MAFSLTLKRTFEEVIDVSCTTEQPESTSFHVPVKRQKLQMTPRKLGLGYRELISLKKSDCDEDFLCAMRQGEGPDVRELRLVTSPPGLMTSPPVRTYREIFPKKKLAANPNLIQSTFEKQFNARAQSCNELTRLALFGQPVVGSACLNLSNPDYQSAAAAAAALLSTSPLRANEVPESSDKSAGGFDGRTLLPQFFQHPSLRDFSILKSGRCLWQSEESSTNATCRNDFSDPQRLVGGSYTRRVAGNGSLGVRSRMSHRLNSEAELASAADEETNTGPVEVCAECQKVFKRKVYLQRHMEREHWLPAKVFKCDDCKYETKHQSNLSVHRRTHTGERPYHCGACGQRYTQGHLLKSHIRSRHAGNLRFYNLDKRSDSTRGRRSLDFKHDVCLTSPNKDVPSVGSVLSGPDVNSIQSIQAFAYHREHFSSYMPRLPTPPQTNWKFPAQSKPRREWPSDGSGSYFALGIIPQRAANDPSFLPSAPEIPFLNRPVNMSSGVSVFPHDLTQFLSTNKKLAYQGDMSSIYDGDDDHSSRVVHLPDSMSCGSDQPRFANDALINVKDDEPDLLHERLTSLQSFPEDLTVTKKPEVYRDDLRTPTPPVIGTIVAGSVFPDNSYEVDVEDDGRRPCTGHSPASTEDSDEPMPKATEPREQNPEYDDCLKKPHQHLAHDFSMQDGELDDGCGEEDESLVRKREMLAGDDDEFPTDLSIARRSPIIGVTVSSELAVNQRNGGTSCADPDSDDNLSSVSTSSSSDGTSAPLKCRLHRILPGQTTDGTTFDGAICPHFQKLQEFRRIVLRFVNAFAPNSLGINDKDESFAETDLIDEIVHAAMFNDVE